MKRFNIFNFIFYKYYRIALFLKHEYPLYFSVGLMSGTYFIIALLVSFRFFKSGTTEVEISFFLIIISAIIYYIVLLRYYKNGEYYLCLIRYYDEFITGKMNLITDVFVVVLTISVIVLPVLFIEYFI